VNNSPTLPRHANLHRLVTGLNRIFPKSAARSNSRSPSRPPSPKTFPRTAALRGQKWSIANFHLCQIQIASGQDLQPGEMALSALSRRGHLTARYSICQLPGPDRAINIDLRQFINRTPDGVAGASHAWCARVAGSRSNCRLIASHFSSQTYTRPRGRSASASTTSASSRNLKAAVLCYARSITRQSSKIRNIPRSAR
jgi:hypothetical protein